MNNLQRAFSQLGSSTRTLLINQFALLIKDLPSLALMSTAAYLLLDPDQPTWTMIRYSFGIALFLVFGSHLTRRLIFPRISVQGLLEEARKGNVASALGAASVCAVLIALMFIMAMPFFK